jgi:hypothetical protein
LNGCQFIIPKHQHYRENIKAAFVVHDSTVILPLDAFSFRNRQESCINHWWFKPKHVSFGCKLWFLYPLLLAYARRFTISLHTQRFNDMYIALKSPVIISLNSLSTTQKLLHQAAVRVCQVANNQDKKPAPIPNGTAFKTQSSSEILLCNIYNWRASASSPCPASSLGFLHANSLV